MKGDDNINTLAASRARGRSFLPRGSKGLYTQELLRVRPGRRGCHSFYSYLFVGRMSLLFGFAAALCLERPIVRKSLNIKADYISGPIYKASQPKGFVPELMTGCLTSSRLRYTIGGDTSCFVSDSGLGDPAKSDRCGTSKRKCEFWLILPEVTAIEVRLSHASRMSAKTWRTAQ